MRPGVGLWAVAEGMGGYGGDVASLRTVAPSVSAAQLLAEFEQRIVQVNADLRAMARARAGAILRAAPVALMVHGPHLHCAVALPALRRPRTGRRPA